jgi:hypothetical protein
VLSLDTHQLLHTGSNHPDHVFSGILMSQAVRFKRLSSREEDFWTAANIVKSVLKHRGYKDDFLDKYLTINPPTREYPSKTEALPLVLNWDPRVVANVDKLKDDWKEFINSNPVYQSHLPDKLTIAWKCDKTIERIVSNKDSLD